MLFLVLPFIPFIADMAVALLYRSRIKVIATRYFVALSAGIVTTAALIELIPEGDVDINYPYLLIGFILFYVVEKLTMLHACGEDECEVHTLTPLSVMGMALDNVVDGLGIAISTLLNPWLGLMLTIAVVVHEIPQAFTSSYILRQLMKPHSYIVYMLALAGLMYPLGALISIYIPIDIYPKIIAFVAGVFLYVGAGDLLMEAHRRFNIKVVMSVLIGVLISIILKMVGGI